MIDMMRTVHGAYAPAGERFGTRLETFFIAKSQPAGCLSKLARPFTLKRLLRRIVLWNKTKLVERL
jgi:hypothetical protein